MSAAKPKGSPVPSFVDNKWLGETILNGKGLEFFVWDTSGSESVTYREVKEWPTPKKHLRVPDDPHDLLEHRIVLLSSGPRPFDTLEALHASQLVFIKKYLDVPDFWQHLIATYVRMTWMYDKFSALPYLRFLGEAETGKTRGLQVAGAQAYRSIMAGGSTTASPIFRLLDLWRGTFIWDEADQSRGSDLTSDIVKILNAGYLDGFPVIRSVQNGKDFDPCPFYVFGPKILATRQRFEDNALESRCITLETSQRMIPESCPVQLPPEFWEEALAIRNQLLCWRLATWAKLQHVRPPELQLRAAQIAIPLYSVALPEFRQELVDFLLGRRREIRAVSPEAMIAQALKNLLDSVDRWPQAVMLKDLTIAANKAKDDWNPDPLVQISYQKVGSVIRSWGFIPKRLPAGFMIPVFKERLEQILKDYAV